MSLIYSTAYIGIGSNLGDRSANILNALRSLIENPKIILKQLSHCYETEPITLSGTSEHWYLNAVAKLETTLTAIKLLRYLQSIEDKMGRVRLRKWDARNIDLDLLLFDDSIEKSKDLILPHPELTKRRFVLEPLAEIAGDVIHPVKGISLRELNLQLKDNKSVKQLYHYRLSELKNIENKPVPSAKK